MFDFDDLEEQLTPRGVLESTGMSDEDFATIGRRLRRAQESHDFEEVTTLICQALCEEELIPKRFPRLASELAGQAQEAAICSDWKASESLLWILWMLSLSSSLHEVRTQRPKANTFPAPCVLIVGFGGSSTDELQSQADWYRSVGFSVISTAPLSWPDTLRERQNDIIAKELRTLFAEGSGQLLVHMCSNGGFGRFSALLAAWTQRLGSFADLPQPEKCISAMVIECAPSRPTDPSTGEVLGGSLGSSSKSDPEKSPAARAELDAVVSSEIDFFQNVLRGCIASLCLKLRIEQPSMLLENGNVALRGAARFGVVGPPSWAHRGSAAGWDFPDFERWDCNLQSPLPRLFLYSDRDALVEQSKIEAYIRHTERYNPQATVLRAIIPRAVHCRLWGAKSNREKCAAAVQKLLAVTDIKVEGQTETVMGA